MAEWPNKKSALGYKVANVLIFTLSLLTLVSMVLSFKQSPVLIAKVARSLHGVLPPQGIGTIIGTIGLTGVVVGWLIARAEDHICGIRLAELVQSIYPHFFQYYFLLFMPVALIGIWASKIDFFWTTLYAFLEVLCHVCMLMRVCYVFVIRSDCRETLAFFYCKRVLQTLGESDKSSEIASILIKTADYTHMLLQKEHREDEGNHLIAFWLEGLKLSFNLEDTWSWDQAKEKYWNEKPDEIIKGITLSRNIWETVLQEEKDPRSRAKIISPLLNALSKSKSNSLTDCCILVGMIQKMFDIYLGHEADLVFELRSLYDEKHHEINKKLTLILATMLLVYRLQDQEDAEKALKTMYTHMRNELLESIHTLRSNPYDDSAGWLMLYAEWFMRHTLKMNMHYYMLMITDEFVDNNSRHNRLFVLDEVGYHFKMLVELLNRLQNEENIKKQKII